LLGPQQLKDSQGGDSGTLLKKAKHFPFVNFIRSQWCGKFQNSVMHQDVGSVGGSAKQMREYFITTGLVVAYYNTFDVSVYTI